MSVDKSPDAFRTISEVADDLDLPQHVLRFWETRFSQIRPLKRGGGRRYYRPEDIDLLRGIRHLLYGEGYTIKGVQRILKEQGAKFVMQVWREDGIPLAALAAQAAASMAEEAPASPVRGRAPAARPRLEAVVLRHVQTDRLRPLRNMPLPRHSTSTATRLSPRPNRSRVASCPRALSRRRRAAAVVSG